MPLFKGFCLAGLLLLSVHGAMRAHAVEEGPTQEQLGKVIVMMASGWYEWPALPQCTYDQKGRFTNTPCLYGGTAYGLKKIVPLEESTVEEELPSWLWRISR